VAFGKPGNGGFHLNVRRSSLDDFPILVQQGNTTKGEGAHHLSIVDLIDAAAERNPDRPALRTVDGVAATHHQLRDESVRIAVDLSAAGVRRGAPVAVLVDHLPESVAVIIAIIRCGAFYVPLDVRWPVARSVDVLTSLSVTMVITSPGLVERASEIAQAVPQVDRMLVADELGASIAAPGSSAADVGAPPAAARPADLAYAITTSGSTGVPKVVGVCHSSVVNLIQWFNQRYGVGPDDVLLQVVSYTFDLSIYDLFGVLAAGASLLLLSDRELAEPDAIVDALLHFPVTLWNSAPSLFTAMLPFVRSRTAGNRKSLRRVFLSGDWVPLSTYDDLAKEFPSATLVALGGPTETCVWANYFEVSGIDPDWRSIPYGWPIGNVRCYVLREDRSPCDVDEPGELYVGGACVSAGYLNDPELTSARFLPDPWSPEPGGRMYRTGDRVQWTSSGWMEFLGRLDNQVKVHGFRIELGEVEYAARKLSEVDEAFAVTFDVSGETELGLVLRTAGGVPERVVRQNLRAQLPEYMLPSVIHVADELPLNTSGKVDRKAFGSFLLALRERQAAEVAKSPAGADTAPLDAGEMTRLWTRILGRPVSADDHFLALGGTSLAAMQLIAALRRDYGIGTSCTSLYRAGSPARFAEQIGQQDEDSESALSWPDFGGEPDRIPLSVQQEAIWFIETLSPGTVGYNSISEVRIKGALDLDRLGVALAAVVARHPALRTRFPEDPEEGVPEQRVGDEVVVNLELVDRPPDSADVVRRAGQHVFDLADEPGVRWLLVRLDDDDHILVQVEHHFVHDGWSQWVLLQDTASAYRQLARGEEVDLGADPVSYADYARWQRNWLSGEQAHRQVEYWCREIGVPGEPLSWPYEERRAPVFTHRGDTHDVRLPQVVEAGVRAYAHTAPTTPFAVLMAAYGVLIGDVCHTARPVLGGGLRNRRLPGVERTVGMFVNTCAFSFAGWPDVTFGELVSATTRRLASAMDHQEIPFPVVARRVGTSMDRSRNPVFQTSISMNDWPDVQLDFGPGTSTTVSFPSNGGAKFDLDIIVLPEAEGTRMLWRYSTPLFTRADVELLVSRYWALLAELVAADDVPLRELTGVDLVESKS
jgi:amino acid adenylation domain-containing protein